MLISMPLSYRFRQLSDRLEAESGRVGWQYFLTTMPVDVERSTLLTAYCSQQVMSNEFWRQARETYNDLAILSRQVDEATGKLVLLSFASNMYFICRQLLHSFRFVWASNKGFPLHGHMWQSEVSFIYRTLRTGLWYNAYFFFSFSYMLLRTVLVSLFAASVNDQSRRPLPVLFSVPAEGFSHEVS